MSITDKEPFKTMKEPSAGALEKLRGWKPPNRAYILFEFERFDIREQQSYMDLWTLNAEDRPDIAHHIYAKLREKRNCAILHFGNFPSLTDANPYRAAHAKKHSGSMGENPWDDLKRICLAEINKVNPAQLKQENTELEKKLAEANLKLEAQTKKVVNERPSKA